MDSRNTFHPNGRLFRTPLTASVKAIPSGTASEIALRLFLFLLLSLVAIAFSTAQGTFTTIQDGNWNDASTWENGDIPSQTLNNFTVVNIEHVVTATSGNIRIKKGSLNITSDGILTVQNGNVQMDPNGRLDLNSGDLYIPAGNLLNKGKNNGGGVYLTAAYIETFGNTRNEGSAIMQFDSACIRVLDGGFQNLSGSTISGTLGNVQVLSANLTNDGTWGEGIEYCVEGNINGTLPIPENCDQVQETCDCLETPCQGQNPDILPGFQAEGNVVVPGLIALSEGEVNENLEDDIFVFGQNGQEVLIEVVFTDYGGALTVLAFFDKEPIDFTYNGALSTDAPSNSIYLFFPIADLAELDLQASANAAVKSVQQILPTQTNSLLTGSTLFNQGDFAGTTFLARAGYELSGSGSKIGILSDSWNTSTSADDASVDEGLGYLPGDDNPNGDINPFYLQEVQVIKDLSPQFGTGIDEGRAMGHIIHSVAPGAQLAFHTAFEGPGPMAEAVVTLAGAGCNIITDDVTHPSQPFFGSGLVSRAIDEVTQSGVQYFTSAGNFGSRSYVADFDPLGNAHQFAPGDTLQKVSLGTGEYLLVLQWSEPFFSIDGGTGALTDLDISLADDNGNTIYQFNTNNLGKDPVEIMPFFVVNATETNIKIVRKGGSGSPRLKYIVYKEGNAPGNFQPIDDMDWAQGTITGHAAAPSAFTLGAVNYTSTPAYGGSLQVVDFSSRGDSDAPNKPNAVAVQGANIGFPLGAANDLDNDGLPNFFGTSASAPHAAATAALLEEAKAKLTLPYGSATEALSNPDNLISTGDLPTEQGNGFISAYDLLKNFANPSPSISGIDISQLGIDPTQGGTVTIEGSYFVDGPNATQVFFRSVIPENEITPSNITDSTITFIIPPYDGGDPFIYTINNALAVGDGGVDSIELLGLPVTAVNVISNGASRKYGEVNPEFTFTTQPALSQEELDLLAPFVTLTSLGEDPFYNVTASVPPITVNIDFDNLPAQLTELYEFNEQSQGVFSISPIELRIQPTNFTAQYGSPLYDLVQNYTYFLGDENSVFDAGIEETILGNLDAAYIGLQQSQDTSYLGIINRISTSGFVTLSNMRTGTFVTLSNELEPGFLTNPGVAFITSQNTLDDNSLLNANPSNSRTTFVSLSNGIGTKVLPIDADLFFDSDANTGVNLSGGERTAWGGQNNENFINGITMANFTELAIEAGIQNVLGTAPTSRLGVSLSNAAAGGVSRIGFVTLSNARNGFVTLSNAAPLSRTGFVTLSNGQGELTNAAGIGRFVTLSNNDNTEIVSMFTPKDIAPADDFDTLGLRMVPINIISGIGVGQQFTIAAAFYADDTTNNVLSGNFIVSYGAGLADITPAPLDVSIGEYTITYGEEVPEIDILLEGLQYADQQDNVIDSIRIEKADGTEYDGSVGTYSIIPVLLGEDSLNYDAVITNGTLIVQPKELFVTAVGTTRPYGADNPAEDSYTFTYTGFIQDESIDNVAIVDPEAITPAPCTADVGTSWDIIPQVETSGSAENYELVAAQPYGQLTIEGKATLTVTVDAVNDRVYGTAAPVLTYLIDGFKCNDDFNSEFQSSDPIPLSVSPEYGDVGEYSIVVGAVEQPLNYTVNVVIPEPTFNVTPATLVVTADPVFREYGAANPELYSFSYTGFVAGDNALNSGIIPPTIENEAPCNLAFGEAFDLHPVGGSAPNYTIVPNETPGQLFVNEKAVLTLTINPVEDLEYGEPFPLLTYSLSGYRCADGFDNVFSGPEAIEISLDKPFINVGEYAITATVNEVPDNYDVVIENQGITFNLTPATLFVKADPVSRGYGEANPDADGYTFSYSGFVNNDDESNVDISDPLAETSAPCNADVGTSWDINPIVATGSAQNYVLQANAVPGQLTVDTKAALTLTVEAVSDVIYGAAEPQLGYEVTGYKCTDNFDGVFADPSDIALTLDNVYGPVGTYTIQVTVPTLTNYNIDVVIPDPDFDVLPKALTVTAVPVSRGYGEDNPLVYDFAYEGFITGENAENVAIVDPVGQTDAVCTSAVGTSWDINPVGGSADNYILVPNALPGQLTVDTKATLTLTVDPVADLVYGAAEPALTYVITGYACTDNFDNVFADPGDIVLSLDNSYGPVGTYTIQVSTPDLGNYLIDVVIPDPTFEVNPATLTVTADPVFRGYGEVNPELYTFSYTGFVNNENAVSAGVIDPVIVDQAPCDLAFGETFDLNPVGGSAPNYVLVPNATPGVLTVNAKATLTVVADDILVFTGDPEPALTFSLVGAKCGEGLDDIFSGPGAVVLSLDQDYGDPGPYEIIVEVTETPANYNVIVENGELFVDNPPNGNPLTFTTDLCVNFTPGHPSGFDYQAKFLYRNTNNFPVYVQNGPDNQFIGPAVTEGPPIEIFEDGGFFGFRVFRVRFDGNDLQWTISSYGETNTSDIVNSNTNACFFPLVKDESAENIDVENEQKEVILHEDNGTALDVKVFPNPFTNVLILKVDQPQGSHLSFVDFGELTIEVRNAVGQLVEYESANLIDATRIRLNLPDLTSGIYFVTLKSEHYSESFKVVRQ